MPEGEPDRTLDANLMRLQRQLAQLVEADDTICDPDTGPDPQWMLNNNLMRLQLHRQMQLFLEKDFAKYPPGHNLVWPTNEFHAVAQSQFQYRHFITEHIQAANQGIPIVQDNRLMPLIHLNVRPVNAAINHIGTYCYMGSANDQLFYPQYEPRGLNFYIVPYVHPSVYAAPVVPAEHEFYQSNLNETGQLMEPEAHPQTGHVDNQVKAVCAQSDEYLYVIPWEHHKNTFAQNPDEEAPLSEIFLELKLPQPENVSSSAEDPVTNENKPLPENVCHLLAENLLGIQPPKEAAIAAHPEDPPEMAHFKLNQLTEQLLELQPQKEGVVADRPDNPVQPRRSEEAEEAQCIERLLYLMDVLKQPIPHQEAENATGPVEVNDNLNMVGRVFAETTRELIERCQKLFETLKEINYEDPD